RPQRRAPYRGWSCAPARSPLQRRPVGGFPLEPAHHRSLPTPHRRRKAPQSRSRRLRQKAAHLRQYSRRARYPVGTTPGHLLMVATEPRYCVAPLRIGSQRATSLLTSSASAPGERPLPSGSTLPSSSSRWRVAGSSSAFDSVSLSLATISFGVPLGANSAFHALTW